VKQLVASLIVLLMLLWGLFDTALALQCDGKVVSMGYHTWKVREICGEPSNIRDIQQIIPRRYYDPYRHIYVDTFIQVNKNVWTYNFGSSRLVYILTFEDDKLTNIETAGYGR
jgi:hypothetical protein